MRTQIFKVVCVLFTLQSHDWRVTAVVEYRKGSPHVSLPNGGELLGKVEFSRDGRPYNSFNGIQYATIPERFQEATPITSPTWTGTLNATQPGASCPQTGYMPGAMVGEDQCLFLNVYVPLTNSGVGKKGLPVMVWIHGGGFRLGSSHEFSPKFFMDEDVIVVTINYRVSLFGFLSTGDNVIPGNNGLKDMVLALKWVQQNIIPFGGDPSKVTIFGESAGGVAVQYLLLSPTTKGLFHRAISQSGSALSLWGYEPNPRQNAVQLANHLKCKTAAESASDISSQEILECLKGFSNEELLKAFDEALSTFLWPQNIRMSLSAPTIEPSDPVSSLTPFLSEPPYSILTNGNSSLAEVPWMVGATEDEGNVMYAGVVLSSEKLIQELNKNWAAIAPSSFDYKQYLPESDQVAVTEKLKKFYFEGKEVSAQDIDKLTNLYSDQFMLHGIYRSAIETARKGKRNPVYFYQYAYKGPISLTGYFLQVTGEATERVGHGDDLVLEFPLEAYVPHLQPLIKPDSEDEKFSKNFIRLLTSFAIHGEPEHEWGNDQGKEWKPISKQQLDGIKPLTWYRLGTNPATVPLSESVLARMQFWDSIWTEYLAPAVLKLSPSGSDSQGKSEL